MVVKSGEVVFPGAQRGQLEMCDGSMWAIKRSGEVRLFAAKNRSDPTVAVVTRTAAVPEILVSAE